MKLADSERRNQLMGQDIGTLKNEYEGKLINIAQEARTLRTDYESKIDLMQRQLDTLNANLNVWFWLRFRFFLACSFRRADCIDPFRKPQDAITTISINSLTQHADTMRMPHNRQSLFDDIMTLLVN